MKTTIELTDNIWERAKEEALHRRISLSEVIEEALRKHLEGKK